MLIVAHPDDEDGGLLTYLSRGQGARVAMLTLTRGEGGQNLMSGDFDDALGLIRTQELLASDRILGVDQFFGTEVDFGFSKTKEETFAKWTHDRVLYDAVRAVRLYRPLVIASVFIGAPSDGHGHHQVSGEIAQEVFNAAGDPSVFPDQIAAGLQPWQPLKVYARVPFARIDTNGMFDYATNQYTPARFTNYVTGKVTTTVPKANVVVPEGSPATYTADGTQLPIPGMDGLSYVQFARKGLALQKTQIGPNVRLAPAGRADVSYHRYGSRVLAPDGKPMPDGDDSGIEPSFYDGIDTSLVGIADLAPSASATLRVILKAGLNGIDNSISNAQADFSPDHPENSAHRLRETLIEVDALITEIKKSSLPTPEKSDVLHELRIKHVQLNNALVLSLGLSLAASTTAVDLPAEAKTSATVQLSEFSNSQTKFIRSWSSNSDGNGIGNGNGSLVSTLEPNHIIECECGLPADQVKATRPYFIRKNGPEQPFYEVDKPSLRNAPATQPALTCWAEIEFQGVRLTLGSVAQHDGQSVSFVPAYSITLSSNVKVLPKTSKSFLLGANVLPSANTTINLPIGLNSRPYPQANSPNELTWTFDLITVNHTPRKPVIISETAVAKDGHIYSEGYRAVGYSGLPYTNYYTPATTRVVPVDVTTASNLNIAYLPGTGDNVPASLEDLGVHAHLLAPADLTADKLKPYDAVVLGVRAYEAHPELAAANAALNAYAAAGGVVIAQYNTGHLPAATGPYPLNLGPSEKVVEETAPVRILAPSDPLLTWPNRITSADFDGWVAERGHGFMSTWDAHYTPLLETHDAGQQPQLGGLLYTRTGRGLWIYLGFALYRQLPEGVPGSYRLFANLLSAAKNPALESSPK
jgi:LmbE family N-acetylglucosaminyl deacetylase